MNGYGQIRSMSLFNSVETSDSQIRYLTLQVKQMNDSLTNYNLE